MAPVVRTTSHHTSREHVLSPTTLNPELTHNFATSPSSANDKAGGCSTRDFEQVKSCDSDVESTRSHRRKISDIPLSVNIDEEFTIDKELGEGTYAKVYLAKDMLDNTTVALKKFTLQEIEDAGKRQRLKQILFHEAKVLSRIHETYPSGCHVVGYSGIHHDKSTDDYFLSLEFLSGGELFDRISETNRLSEMKVAEIFKHLVVGVDAIHRCGIVHRDLKPENILFKESANASLKIADFGTAYVVDEPQEDLHKGTRIGSPGYFAPEVYRCKYGPECDIWSLGVILYCLLSGRHPFPGETESSIMLRVITGNYTMEDEFWEGISDVAKDLVSKLLVVNPNERLTLEHIMAHPFLQTISTKCLDTRPEEANEHELSEVRNPKQRFSKVIKCIQFVHRLKHRDDYV